MKVLTVHVHLYYIKEDDSCFKVHIVTGKQVSVVPNVS